MPRDHHEVQNADLIISRVEREQERHVMENERRRWNKYDTLLEHARSVSKSPDVGAKRKADWK
jgi:hypothetical protein